MANPTEAIRSGVGKLQETLNGSIEDKKLQQMAQNMKDVHDPKNRITTDYGITQSNTGMWNPLPLPTFPRSVLTIIRP